MTTWEDIFSPVMKTGREVRQGQAQLGQAIIDVIEDGGSLIGEAGTGTGKSFATLLPMIHSILEAKKKSKIFRCVVSTETITLQNQLFDKDLPFLQSLYPGFVYRKLMGRTNYLCLYAASLSARGDGNLDAVVEKLKSSQARLTSGERADVESVLGYELPTEWWDKITGSSKFCSDNKCETDKCYSTLARNRAMTADLVVVNHALLATDAEMKASAGGGAFEDGLLGQIDVLAVDEGHQLEPVLVSQWTKQLSDWELQEMSTSITNGVDFARSVISNHAIGYTANDAMDGLKDMLNNIKRFYGYLVEMAGEDWKGSSSALGVKYLKGSEPAHVLAAMREYEEETPQRLKKAEEALVKIIKYLGPAAEQARIEKTGNLRKINKGLTASKSLLEIVQIISKALETKDGIIHQYGAFGAIVDGWVRRTGEHGMTLRLVPLDVSDRAKFIWAGVKSKILISATLTDLTDNSFKYARDCVGFPAGKEIQVDTPFSLRTQQLVYVSPANRPVVDGARYNFDELLELLQASDGRALVLFTSRKELDWAAEELIKLRHEGKFAHNVLVQEKDSNKQKLADQFKNDIHSVLIATRSFFTGFDAQGATLSLVAICKFPLPRYSVECRQQISHWRKRGFPKWYEREALTVLQQAAGRLIRSSDCTGVVALLDERLMQTNSNIYKTAALGIKSLGSPVTQDIEAVKGFLSA